MCILHHSAAVAVLILLLLYLVHDLFLLLDQPSVVLVVVIELGVNLVGQVAQVVVLIVLEHQSRTTLQVHHKSCFILEVLREDEFFIEDHGGLEASEDTALDDLIPSLVLIDFLVIKPLPLQQHGHIYCQ